MNYAICIKNKKPQLVEYDYSWSGNKFFYTFGTSSRQFWDYDELPFEIVADLSYQSKYKGGWLDPYEYPENNTLEVKFKKDFKIDESEIFKLKGFKSFFSHKKIKNVKIINE